MRFLMFGAAFAALGALCVGCGSSDPTASMTPEQFLKWSMDRYAGLNSFKANCDWETKYTGQGFEDKDINQARTVSYLSPNMFRVTSMSHKIELSATSDGSRMVISTNEPNDVPTAYKAPASLDSTQNKLMMEPVLCGTLLYNFFGGSPRYDEVVDSSKSQPSFGKEETVNGEPSKHVLFYGAGPYGHVDMLIGEQTGLVYRIAYDSAPLVQTAEQAKLQGKLKGPIPESSDTVESYEQVQPNPTINSAAFVFAAPKGKQVIDMDALDSARSPIPVGAPVPNFTLTSVDGSKKESLSSLKGQIVLLDFWATWCGPCRATLPHTLDLYKKYGDRGLAVMTVSDETSAKISAFLQKQHYDFPAFRDPSHEAEQIFAIGGLPTMVIIDKKGDLADYIVGERSEDYVLQALKKAGMSS